MGKIRNFASFQIRKIVGGKDPIRLIEELILKRQQDPDKCLREHGADFSRWMIPLSEEQDLEVLVDNIKKPQETTIYLGVNVAVVPLKKTQDFLTTALELADGLVGIKLSLIGHYLVLSSCTPAGSMAVEDLEYIFSLIQSQQKWFCESLVQELGEEVLSE